MKYLDGIHSKQINWLLAFDWNYIDAMSIREYEA